MACSYRRSAVAENSDEEWSLCINPQIKLGKYMSHVIIYIGMCCFAWACIMSISAFTASQ